MPNRVQTLRSSVPGSAPQTGTRAPGELWLNFADAHLGYIDASQTAQKLLAVRLFVSTAPYAVGDFVVYAGNLYQATAPSAAGAFTAANWTKIGTAQDLSQYLPLAGGTLTGALTLPAAAPANANQAANKSYVDLGDAASLQAANTKVPLAGGTMTGPLTLSGAPTQPLQAATKAYVDSGAFVPVSGGTMTGPLVLAADPVAPMQAATKQYVDGGRLGDNRLINGDMRIDQRNNGASGTANGYTVDRWWFNGGGGAAGKMSWGRNYGGAIGPPAFPYCFGVRTTTAYTPAASEAVQVRQAIEADMIADFQWGTANAQPVTLSFWFYGVTAGLYGGSIFNGGSNRSYPFSFNIPVANTWNFISFTIPGDTTGTWALSGNGAGLYLNFDGGSVATYRGPAGAWAGTLYLGATGTIVPVATLSAGFYITGVKLEVGSVATPYNRQSLAKSQADCERYFRWLPFNQRFTASIAGGVLVASLPFSAMRASPTISAIGADPNSSPQGANNAGNTFNYITPYSTGVVLTAAAAGDTYILGYRSSASAEL